MSSAAHMSAIQDVINTRSEELLTEWMEAQRAAGTTRGDLIGEAELREQCRRFLTVLSRALRQDGAAEFEGSEWADAREFLAGVSKSRADQGFSPSETATFVFSLKQPLFERLRQDLERQPAQLADEIWGATLLLDRLGLYTTEIHQRRREEVIRRQQDEILELSTPVVELWDEVVAVPLIGTLDSGRTQT